MKIFSNLLKSLNIAYYFSESIIRKECKMIGEQLIMVGAMIGCGILSVVIFSLNKIDAIIFYWGSYFCSFAISNFIRSQINSLSLRKYRVSPLIPGFLFLFLPIVVLIRSVILTSISCFLLPNVLDLLLIPYGELSYSFYPTFFTSIDRNDITSCVNMVFIVTYSYVIRALCKGNFLVQTTLFATFIAPFIQCFADNNIGRLDFTKFFSLVYIGNFLIKNYFFYWIVLIVCINIMAHVALDKNTESNNFK